MAANRINSYGRFLQGQQTLGCSYTGPTGPVGPVGPQGISTGLIYYFYTESNTGPYIPQPQEGVVGPTGFGMLTSPKAGPGLPPGNPKTGYTGYNGYFSWHNASSYNASNPKGLLAEFKLPMTNYTNIPQGTYNFSTNIYSYDITNPIGSIPVSISPVISYINGSGVSTIIGGGTGINRSFIVGGTGTSPIDDTPYNYSVSVPSSTYVGNTGNLDIQFFITQPYTFSASQVVEFWTEGDSISQVITTFAPQQGPTGSKGDTGASGSTGSTGPTGSPGATGSTGPTGQKGDTGAAGPAASKGDTGATGQKGDTGASGQKGDTGASGPKGDTGASGLDGRQGSTGFTGYTGYTGPGGFQMTSNVGSSTSPLNITIPTLNQLPYFVNTQGGFAGLINLTMIPPFPVGQCVFKAILVAGGSPSSSVTINFKNSSGGITYTRNQIILNDTGGITDPGQYWWYEVWATSTNTILEYYYLSAGRHSTYQNF